MTEIDMENKEPKADEVDDEIRKAIKNWTSSFIMGSQKKVKMPWYKEQSEIMKRKFDTLYKRKYYQEAIDEFVKRMGDELIIENEIWDEIWDEIWNKILKISKKMKSEKESK